jgi:flagellar motor switch protein FliN/FliY
MSQPTQPATNPDALEHALDQAADAIRVQTSRLETLEAAKPAGDALGLEGLRDVPLPVTIELGRTRVPLAELIALAPGSLVTLQRGAHEPADVYVGGKLFARGEVVTVGDKYGLRVTEIV